MNQKSKNKWENKTSENDSGEKILAIVSWEKQKIKRGAVVEKRPN